ncbi:MAG: uroporphyrinogen-III synthase [Acidobacteriota bacterium]
MLLTREPPDNDALAARVREHGWPVLEWPALATELLPPPAGRDGLTADLERASWVVPTSRRALRGLLAGLDDDLPTLTRLLASCQVASIGPATSRELVRLGLQPALEAPGTGDEALATLLLDRLEAPARCLLVRSAAADERFPDRLRAAGHEVEDRRLHRPVEPAPRQDDERPLAAVHCASPSAARRLLSWNPWLTAVPFVALGPTTAEALEREGVTRVVQAAGPELDDVMTALATCLASSDHR